MVQAGGLRAGDLDPATMMPDEWTEFRFERLAVLRANPDLAAADKQLDEDMKAQAGKVEAAMAKADPGVAPILAKVAALLHGNWDAAGVQGVSVAEWQELRAARAAALAANPDLAAVNEALLKKKKDLDARIDAALVKADPGLASFVGKLQARDGVGKAQP